MASRKHLPPENEGRPSPTSGLLRHGPVPGGHRSVETLPPRFLPLDAQVADIQQLVTDNRRLAATHAALRQDLLAAENEVQRLSDHIRRMRTESDIEVRSMLDKIKMLELEIKAGENVKTELYQARIDARNLALERQELTGKIQLASRELDKARADVKRLPDLHAELDTLRQEFQRLRVTFEHEKGLNVKKVEEMRAMEKDIVAMSAEVEKLRVEVSNGENRANAPQPYGGLYVNPTTLYPTGMYGSTGYADNYPRAPVPMDGGALPPGMAPYDGSVYTAPPAGAGAGVAAAVAGGNPAWSATYDPSYGSR